MEDHMRRTILLTAATLALLAAGTLTPNSAQAITISTPAGIAAAAEGNSLAQDVAYTCRRVWRCTYRGCGWRRTCYRTSPRYYHTPRYYNPRHYSWRYRHAPRYRYYYRW
jgi:hypothetical protein